VVRCKARGFVRRSSCPSGVFRFGARVTRRFRLRWLSERGCHDCAGTDRLGMLKRVPVQGDFGRSGPDFGRDSSLVADIARLVGRVLWERAPAAIGLEFIGAGAASYKTSSDICPDSGLPHSHRPCHPARISPRHRPTQTGTMPVFKNQRRRDLIPNHPHIRFATRRAAACKKRFCLLLSRLTKAGRLQARSAWRNGFEVSS
jgi:hypothetical protein